MNVYRVAVEQWTQYGGKPILHNKDAFAVRAGTAQQAISRALAHARQDGYLKSRPIEVVSVERIAADVL